MAVTSSRIRVFLLDDHTVLRQAVRVMLEAEGIEVVGEAGDVESGVAEVVRTDPDVALVDLKMPGVSGLEAIRRILSDAPRTGIVVFTMYNNPAYVYEAMNAGASGYILKSATRDELVRAVRAVHQGSGFLQAEVTKPLLLRLASDAKVESDRTNLTLREIEIVEMLADGNGNREIARSLSISEETIKTHLRRIYEKLGASDRAQAVAIALRQHLIE
jgi:DNA-binding NarL/FixJ family response regulator